MNYITLYSILYRVRGPTRTAAKVFTWLFGVQLLVLCGLATIADAPPTSPTGPSLHSAATLTALISAPRAFDAASTRISARYRRVRPFGTKKTAS